MSVPAFRIVSAALADWPDIERIYRQGIRTGHVTFETENGIPDGERWFAEHLPGLVFKAVVESERTVGVREKLGKMGDLWRDVALMERPSPSLW